MKIIASDCSKSLPETHTRKKGLTVAIDASRNRSGGAKVHLVGILTALDPREHGLETVHVWSYAKLLDLLPDVPWLIKHADPALEQSLFHQVIWQYRQLPREVEEHRCDVLLTTDAGSVCRFSPSVVMSRDMLSFEPGEISRFGVSFARLRLIALRYIQVNSLRRATAALFLTRYAAEVIGRFTGKLKRVHIIPHGIGPQFRTLRTTPPRAESGKLFKCVYVSNFDLYKHQWQVVRAIGSLREAGHLVSLSLIGGGSGPARRLLDKTVAQIDPRGLFVEIIEMVPHSEVPRFIAVADIFVFASSCENMPNTLVEAMAGGVPIACSNRGPMPEVLRDGGVYFDPENPASIAGAIAELLLDERLRLSLAGKAKELSNQYTWERCARETWTLLREIGSKERMPDTNQ